MNNIERTIAQLDEQKKLTNAAAPVSDGPEGSHAVRTTSSRSWRTQLNLAEERWCVLLEELGEFD